MGPTPSVSSALLAAETVCMARGVRLTSTRKAVLQTLWEAHCPLGAYEILERMGMALDRRVAPPTVYRALDFLLGQKFISKIESRNAFVPCAHPDHPHACFFFVCENCGVSEEIEDPSLEQHFEQRANALGFRISRPVLELQGICAACLAAVPHS